MFDFGSKDMDNFNSLYEKAGKKLRFHFFFGNEKGKPVYIFSVFFVIDMAGVLTDVGKMAYICALYD
jgi:hypothetical protein